MQNNEKKAILRIVKIVSQKDMTNINVAHDVYRDLEADLEFVTTAFGDRFITRLGKIVKGQVDTDTCILCGKNHASNKLVCEVCVAALQSRVAAMANNKESIENKSEEPVSTESDVSGETVEDETGNCYTEISEEVNESSMEVDDISFARLRKEMYESDRYTENLIRNLDASMDRLASRKSVNNSNRLLKAVLVISLVNTICIIAIGVMVFLCLGML